MISEFFCAPERHIRLFAVIGALLLGTHSVYSAILSRWLVEWQGRFYDSIGDAAKIVALASATNSSSSGASIDGAIETGAEQVGSLLAQFLQLVMPMAFIHPVNRYFRRAYTFKWRMVLMKAYTNRWSSMSQQQLARCSCSAISQRIQEDTQRFSRGLETCVSEILDAMLTLFVFTPSLVELGGKLHPEGFVAICLSGPFGAWWLLVLAIVLAAAGWLISLIVAARLVGLEVKNQSTEAEFRKELVLAEVGPAANGTEHTEEGQQATCDQPISNPLGQAVPQEVLERSFNLLQKNYSALYRHFFAFDTWTSLFDQAMTILPYIIVTPMLFRRTNAASLGTLVQVSSTFGRVFSALSLPAFNWAAVNDFRSVIRRLSEMEKSLTVCRKRSGRVSDIRIRRRRRAIRSNAELRGEAELIVFPPYENEPDPDKVQEVNLDR